MLGQRSNVSDQLQHLKVKHPPTHNPIVYIQHLLNLNSFFFKQHSESLLCLCFVNAHPASSAFFQSKFIFKQS